MSRRGGEGLRRGDKGPDMEEVEGVLAGNRDCKGKRGVIRGT